MRCSSSVLSFLLMAFCTSLISISARALDLDAPIVINVPAESLENALLDLSKQASFQLVISAGSIPARQTKAISGTLSVRRALELLLRDTTLNYQYLGEHTIAVAPRA